MKSILWSMLATLALVATALASKFPVSSLQRAKSTPGRVVPNKFIVELSAPSGNTKRDVLSREVRWSLSMYSYVADTHTT